jgi:hypothetical protein
MSRLLETFASRSRVLMLGERPPTSNRAIVDCVVPIRRASSRCESPARTRAEIISFRKADTGFMESSSSAKAASASAAIHT